MAIERIKFYFRVFSSRLLLKDSSFFLGFSFLVLLGGFTIPSMDLYKLISRAIVSNSINPFYIYLLLAVVIFLNLLLIKASLSEKYSLRNQATIASLLIFTSFALLSFLGFWLRVNLEYVTPKEDVILGIVNSSIKASLPPSPLPIAVTVSFTVSLFGIVFTLASGSYSKVDYSPFKSWIAKTIKSIDSNNTDIEILGQYIDCAIDALSKTLPYERKRYRLFVEDSLLKPLLTLHEFIESYAQNQPELINELRIDITRVKKLSEYNNAYKMIKKLYETG